MADEQLVVMTKEDALVVRWLTLATAQEKDRPVLRCLHKAGGLVEAADGLRVHRYMGIPSCMSALEDGLWLVNDGKPTYKGKGRAYPLERIEGIFPDVNAIWPDSRLHAAFAVRPEYMQDAVDLPPNGYRAAHVKVRTYATPLEVESPDGKCKALVMPIHLTGDLKDVSHAVMDALKYGPVGHWLKENQPNAYRAAVVALAKEAEGEEVENG